MPVACVLVVVFVPTVGLVQAEPSFFRTMNCVVSAPGCTSVEVWLNVALAVVKMTGPGKPGE
jgi:hypothetical protein